MCKCGCSLQRHQHSLTSASLLCRAAVLQFRSGQCADDVMKCYTSVSINKTKLKLARRSSLNEGAGESKETVTAKPAEIAIKMEQLKKSELLSHLFCAFWTGIITCCCLSPCPPSLQSATMHGIYEACLCVCVCVKFSLRYVKAKVSSKAGYFCKLT